MPDPFSPPSPPPRMATRPSPLLTLDQMAQLLANWVMNDRADESSLDFRPAVRLYTPDARAVWLLTELNPADGDTLYGLCDLGLGQPELGYASLSELQSVRGPWGLPVERDRQFQADRTLSQYAELARQAGRIVT